MYIDFKLNFTFHLVIEFLNFQVLLHVHKYLGMPFIYKKNGTTGAEELLTMSILKTHEG